MGPVLAQEGIEQNQPTIFHEEQNDENQPNHPKNDRSRHTCQPVSGSRCGRWTVQIFKIFQGGSTKVGSSTDGLQTNGHAKTDAFPGEPSAVILCDPRPFKFSATKANKEHEVIFCQPRQCSTKQCSPRQCSQTTANTKQFSACQFGTTTANAEFEVILDDPRPGSRAIEKREYKVSCCHTRQFSASQFSAQQFSA